MILVPISQTDQWGNNAYVGGWVFAQIVDSDGQTVLAEARSGVLSVAPPGTLSDITPITFDFKTEPRLHPNRDYYLTIHTTGESTVKIRWAGAEWFGYNGPWPAWPTGWRHQKLLKQLYFRNAPDYDLGGFSIVPTPGPNPPSIIDDQCFGKNERSCSVYYQLPASNISPNGYSVSAELWAVDDVRYDCGDVPLGCNQGRFGQGCDVLGAVTVATEAWWQGGTGGDVYGRAGITSVIPAAPTPYLIPGAPGIAIAGYGYTVSTNAKTISSSNNWRMNNYALNGIDSPDTKGYSYNYFYNKLKDKVTRSIIDPQSTRTWAGDLSSYIGSADIDRVVLIENTGNLIVGSPTVSSSYTNGGTAIVLVDNGNLTINNNITVGANSALVFIVDGDITINSSVTRIDGVYFAEGVFSTGSSNSQLVGKGSWFVSPDGQFTLGRDLGVNNATTPAEKVDFEPKYLLKLIEMLGESTYIWQEVAG